MLLSAATARLYTLIIIINHSNMSTCLKFLCCCCDFSQQNPETQQRVQRKSKRKPTPQTRIDTQYKQSDIVQMERGEPKAYCCPICTLYFNHILACGACSNFICRSCCQQYEAKTLATKTQLKCPFCGSGVAKFVDYELEPHSYFDTTKKGFLSKEERNQFDQQMVVGESVEEVRNDLVPPAVSP